MSGPAGTGQAMRRRIGRLTKRPEFLAVAGTKRKWGTAGVVLQARAHDDRQKPAPGTPDLRLGLTASKKVGMAVERNRARRRLRAAARDLLPAHAAPGHDLVLIARPETVRRPYALLKDDLAKALKKLGLWRDAAEPGRRDGTEPGRNDSTEPGR